jgi:ribosomal protein S18 acetylase RimI-like enzyme
MSQNLASNTYFETQIPDWNIFMMCKKLKRNAISELKTQYTVRSMRADEMDFWLNVPFDNEQESLEYRQFMLDYFENVFETKKDKFYSDTKVVCNTNDEPIATCLIWKIYDKFYTIQWFKVLKQYENQGIGRALLSIVLKDLDDSIYPIYLHTQPSSYRAIKLYSDFGFQLLDCGKVGSRQNDLQKCIPLLKEMIPNNEFDKLKVTQPSIEFLDFMKNQTLDQF